MYVDRRGGVDLRGRSDGAYGAKRRCWNYDLFGLLRVAIIYTLLPRWYKGAAPAQRTGRTRTGCGQRHRLALLQPDHAGLAPGHAVAPIRVKTRTFAGGAVLPARHPHHA